jgi:tRNA dimethylallyltransferase
VRARLDTRAADDGWPALHAELARLDPATAARLDPTDSQRIQRALEVYALSGRPISALRGARRSPAEAGLVSLALIPQDRAELHRRIAIRFDAMLAAGLVDELAGLRRRFRLDASMPSMRCVGYRQAWQFIDGDGDCDALRERGAAATRQLARRQLTWLRSLDVATFDAYATQGADVAGWLAGQGVAA